MICPCCGEEYNVSEGQSACQGCPASRMCALTRCPHCGYESAKEPGFVSRLKAFFMPQPLRPPDCPQDTADRRMPMSLADLEAGDTAVVEGFREHAHVRKFLSMGILPGTHVVLVKKSPAVVIRAGYSEFAFDRTLAGIVKVHRLGDRGN
jgi:Fe2+ transport system protein FeoA